MRGCAHLDRELSEGVAETVRGGSAFERLWCPQKRVEQVCSSLASRRVREVLQTAKARRPFEKG